MRLLLILILNTFIFGCNSVSKVTRHGSKKDNPVRTVAMDEPTIGASVVNHSSGKAKMVRMAQLMFNLAHCRLDKTKRTHTSGDVKYHYAYQCLLGDSGVSFREKNFYSLVKHYASSKDLGCSVGLEGNLLSITAMSSQAEASLAKGDFIKCIEVSDLEFKEFTVNGDNGLVFMSYKSVPLAIW